MRGLEVWALVWKETLAVSEDAREVALEEEAPTTQLEAPVGESGSSEEEATPSAKKLKTVDREASYVIVASPGGVSRLHRAGSYGCWMGRKRDFRDATEFDTKPPSSRYTHVCKLCWPPKADDGDSESGEASSASILGRAHGLDSRRHEGSMPNVKNSFWRGVSSSTPSACRDPGHYAAK